MDQHDALMDAVRRDPDDDGAWAVLQDWLIAHDDPRAQPLDAGLAERWFGQPAVVQGPNVTLYDEGGRDTDYDRHVSLELDRGHVRKLKVDTRWDGDQDDWGPRWFLPLLHRILSQPVGQLVLEMEIRATPNREFEYEGLVEAITEHGPLAVRKLYAGDGDQHSWTVVPDVTSLWAAAPWLEEVELEGSAIALGELHHDRLRELSLVSGGLPTEPVQALVRARVPSLHTLDLWFGSSRYGAECGASDVVPLLQRELPSLRRAGLRNCEFSDELVPLLLQARWLPQLEELWLGGSVLTDKAGEALLRGKDSLRHLRKLDVSECYLSAEMVSRLSSVWGDALAAAEQRLGNGRNGQSYYYVNVGE